MQILIIMKQLISCNYESSGVDRTWLLGVEPFDKKQTNDRYKLFGIISALELPKVSFSIKVYKCMFF